MISFLLGVALVAQPTFNNGPPPSMPPPHHESTEGREAARTGSARQVLHAFGACVADRNALLADRILRMDEGESGYRRRLSEIVRRDRDCFRQTGGRMGFATLAMAGAMAEHLLERDQTPLNVRLARAALGSAPATRSVPERVAMCVARSVPDEVTALLATSIDSEAETAAVEALMPAFNACSQDGAPISVSTAGVRATLAAAAYRSLSVQVGGR